MLLKGRSHIILLLFGWILYHELVDGELTGYPASQTPPNGLIDEDGNINFSELALSLMNDFVLMAQVFVTCIPSTVLAAATPLFVKVSCAFNLLSVMSLLSLSILDGWDRLDECGPFKAQMTGFFENWAEDHTHDANYMIKRDSDTVNNPIDKVCKELGLHLDLYVKANTLEKQRLICSSLEVRNSTFFDNKPLFQELCVSKSGIKKLGRSRFAQMPINTTKKLARFLINGGLFKTAINPPLYLFNIIQAYANYSEEIMQKMYEMTVIIKSKSWDGGDVAMQVQEEGELLLSINYRRGELII